MKSTIWESPVRDTRGAIEAMALYASGAVGLVREKQAAHDILIDLARGCTPSLTSSGLC